MTMMTWTAEKNAELLKLHNQGYPASYIASWMELDLARVKERLQQLGLARQAAHWWDKMPRSARSFHALYRRAAAGSSPK
jgi:hypothetical protein